MKVICEQANMHPACELCYAAEPHDPITLDCTSKQCDVEPHRCESGVFAKCINIAKEKKQCQI